MEAYSAARSTSLMIMFIRRSSRSATAPASGPSSRAGNSDVSQTAPTAEAWAATPRLARIVASAVSASRLSQSPRLDSDVAIHRRRNGLMDSTLPLPVSPGNRKVTALGYRSRLPRAAWPRRNALAQPIWAAMTTGSRRHHDIGYSDIVITVRRGAGTAARRHRATLGQPAPVGDGRLREELPGRRGAGAPADDRRAVPPDRRRGVAGPAARRSASSSIARWTVIESTSSPWRSEALVSPSVTYGPYRPSLITIGRLEDGSFPSSRSGGAAARPPRVLGWSNRSLASASVTVKSCSSLSRERLSLPFFT